MHRHLSRREFLATTGALASAWIGSDPGAFARALEARREQEPRFRVLAPEQAADLEAIAAQIIPTDEFPGAREARAIVFIDRALEGFAKDQLPTILDGLEDLSRRIRALGAPAGRRFAQLPDAQQVALLREIEETPFFQQVRFATIVGTFGHPSLGGNHEGSGWRALGFEPRFVWQPPFGEYDAAVERGR